MAEMIDSIRVNGQDYTFTLSSGSNLTLGSLTVNGALVAQNISASGAITGNIKTNRIEPDISTGSMLIISAPTLLLSTLSNKKIFYTMSYDSGSKALYITSSNTLGG